MKWVNSSPLASSKLSLLVNYTSDVRSLHAYKHGLCMETAGLGWVHILSVWHNFEQNSCNTLPCWNFIVHIRVPNSQFKIKQCSIAQRRNPKWRWKNAHRCTLKYKNKISIFTFFDNLVGTNISICSSKGRFRLLSVSHRLTDISLALHKGTAIHNLSHIYQTQLALDIMDAISLTIFWCEFLWIIFIFLLLIFHWSWPDSLTHVYGNNGRWIKHSSHTVSAINSVIYWHPQKETWHDTYQ